MAEQHVDVVPPPEAVIAVGVVGLPAQQEIGAIGVGRPVLRVAVQPAAETGDRLLPGRVGSILAIFGLRPVSSSKGNSTPAASR